MSAAGYPLARARLDLTHPGCGAVLHHTGSRPRAWATAVAWLDRPAEHDADDPNVVSLTVADGTELRQLCDRLELVVGQGSVRAACGGRVSGAVGYRGSFAEARRLLRVARRRGAEVLPFADSGLLQLLLESPPDRLRWFVDRHLGPLLSRPELMVTLRAWLATNGSRQAASQLLHLHRNSVGYRVGLVKELLGIDPLHPANAAVLHTALAARDLLDSDADPLPSGDRSLRPAR